MQITLSGLELIQLAINREKESFVLYSRAAAQAGSLKVKKVLDRIARDELVVCPAGEDEEARIALQRIVHDETDHIKVLSRLGDKEINDATVEEQWKKRNSIKSLAELVL